MAALTDGHNPFSESDFIKRIQSILAFCQRWSIEMFQMNSDAVLFKLLQY